MARFVSDVVEALDLSAIYAEDEEGDGRGRAAYDLRMMVRVLIYGYCRRVASSRRIERAMYEDVAFRYLAEIQPYIKILPEALELKPQDRVPRERSFPVSDLPTGGEGRV